ncbi:MAG TPA: TAT-variant-translocated molybdopterin oxidoreductase, partial [Ignavibacteriaceae bacterium]|nr:TAT-variant-translocated molybdopterin oxidoreductase [Ignavibacteriaceae bacterium]
MSETQDNLHNNPTDNNPDVNYWRSLEELYNDPELIEASHHEFKDGVTDDFNPSKLSGLSRRKFIALLSASGALAGAGCSDYRDKGEIIPYVKKPEEITPGKPTYYASTCNACSNACGILIKTREGRPIKVDGNPDHPVSKGKICSKGHANILKLYDPERLHSPHKRTGENLNEISWLNADKEIMTSLANNGDKEIAIISRRINSPTAKKVLDDFKAKYPSSKVYAYELFNDEVKNSAWQKSYGEGRFPLINWNKAKIIVALESDFLGTEGNIVENARLFSEGRDVSDLNNFNRLYVLEGNMSLTGSNADYRLRLNPEAQYEFVSMLINETGGGGGGMSADSFAKKFNLPANILKYLINDLKDNRGNSIVYAGNSLPEVVHIAVNHLNNQLGNDSLYKTEELVFDVLPLSSKTELEELINKMNNNQVGIVIHYDSNPVYHFASDYGYESALKKVSVVISLTECENESSEYAHYVLPVNHNFESWGDAKNRTGFYSLQQPVIWPIFDSRQKEIILLNWINGEPEKYDFKIYHQYLMKNWEENIYPSMNSRFDFKRFWLGALEDGVVLTSDTVGTKGKYNPSSFSSNGNNQNLSSGYTVILRESYATGDGSFANNGWMQELPHPVSKITWDNYAAISNSTATELGVTSNDLIDIQIAGRKLTIPVFIQPGSADKIVTIELGYGRTKVGVVGFGVGVNANVLLSKDGGISPWIYNNATIKKADGTYKLITAQEHHAFDKDLTKDAVEKRKIIREGTVSEYKKNPAFIQAESEMGNDSLYPSYKYTGLKWGMAIDLNKCLGCGECVVACNSENNVPVVGKDQVEKGREMHWLRVDRYYSGTIDQPKVSTQLVLCQHCDKAPCENVCPVAATMHSPDGLNQMVYNRCVGTRYCSNNCPYKVRRFNFFNFRDHFRDSYQEDKLFYMIYNPEVTVRSRGVMEKCTFCIQRIMDARASAIHDDRQLKGSDVKTACQEACGTNAIKFGDINDKEDEFFTYRNHQLGY